MAKAMKDPSFQGSLHKFCNGRVASPTHASASRIADHFKIPIEAIYNDKIAEKVYRDIFNADSPSPGNVDDHDRQDGNAEFASAPGVGRRTPVVGTAKLGDNGFFEQLSSPDGWVAGYSAEADAYALRVRGDSMHPAIRHGSFVIVEPHGRCVVGEYVAIALADGRKMVKELVIERPDEIVVESVNGNHRQTIDRADIETLHPVGAVIPASKWQPA